MKQSTKTLLLAALMSLINITAFAYDIAVENEDGVTIYYNYINNKTELAVCQGPNYSGEINIPEFVRYNQKSIRVTSISSYAFRNCTDLTSIKIPSSVTSIGESAFWDCI